MEEQTLFLDSQGREWQVGTVQEPIVVEKLIMLSILVEPMYPSVVLDPTEDYIYCMCAKCGQPIQEEYGLLTLYFSAVSWGVRIVCTVHCNELITRHCAHPIINVGRILQPIVEEACVKKLPNCVVCDRVDCMDETCMAVKERGILYRNRIDELMAHFYRVRLNVISPLLGACDACGDQVQQATVICKRCKGVFCSRACLKQKRRHVCRRVEKLYL